MIVPRLRQVAMVAGGIVVVAGAALSLGSGCTVEETATHHICRLCGSYRVESTRTVDGVKGQTSVEFRPSATFTDLLGDDHLHHFAFDFRNTERSTGSWWPWRGGGRHTHGDGFPGHSGRMPNRFTVEYNADPPFQALVRTRMSSGDISNELAEQVVLLRDLDGSSEAASKARALLLER